MRTYIQYICIYTENEKKKEKEREYEMEGDKDQNYALQKYRKTLRVLENFKTIS